jgi:predicted nucleic acid-binding protein
MAANVVVDAGFLIALFIGRDSNHRWADHVARQHPPPWKTCEAAISETFHMVGARDQYSMLLRRGAIVPAFHFNEATESVLRLMEKYADVPMSFADACLVHMSEVLPDPIVLTTDADFRVYRRSNRQVVPCVLPD